VNVIEVINGGILLSQALQYTARRLGEGQVQGNAAAAQLPFKNILKGLQQLKIVLEQSLPRVTFGPVFPGGCDTDAVTVACKDFRLFDHYADILLQAKLTSSTRGQSSNL
jgi:hypothetical protein